ncbi:MAG: RNA pseudouridine synthase [Planctomycetes bacterium]|jgi:23S rRNA pseudouridine1911/1915/1917 synthase|nr:RNA pseudouridine synthase [Planctomycetota bacterium]HJO25825.1 RluA family pseudouridine synthase [Planctomycetota bacterium]
MGLFPKNRDLSRPLEHVTIAVDASALQLPVEEVNLRLDQFLQHHLPWKSRSALQGLIRSGLVCVADGAGGAEVQAAGQVERRPGRRVRHGFVVSVDIPPEARITPVSSAGDELTILREDDHTLVVEKPPGLPVHPSGRHLADSLIQRVHGYYAAQGEKTAEEQSRPRLCHRLDRETTGIVLLGKHAEAHAELSRQFEEREVEKEYLAIVEGLPQEAAGVIDLPIGPSRTSSVRLRMAVRADGQQARTDWSLVASGGGRSLLRLHLHTGRQHQIRVHCAALGHPLVGDKLYLGGEDVFERALADALTAEDRSRLGLGRQALHHHRLTFTCPDSGERIQVVSPMPADMEALMGVHGEEGWV